MMISGVFPYFVAVLRLTQTKMFLTHKLHKHGYTMYLFITHSILLSVLQMNTVCLSSFLVDFVK